MDLVKKDDSTGLRLYAEVLERQVRSGDIIYRFETVPPRPLPDHLRPSDPFSPHQALEAFERFVAWLKAKSSN